MVQDKIDKMNMAEIFNEATKKAGMEAEMDYKTKAILILLCEDIMRLGYNGGIKTSIEICKKKCVQDIIPHLKAEKVKRLRDKMTKDEMAQYMGEKQWH